MKKELVDLQPKLEQAKIENTKMMKVNTFHTIDPHHYPPQSTYVSEHTYSRTKCKHVLIFRLSRWSLWRWKPRAKLCGLMRRQQP